MLTGTVTSYSDIAGALREASTAAATVRICGGGSKAGWGNPGAPGAIPLSTLGLDQILEHNAGDLTAVVQAGVRLVDAQKAFAQAGQMLALDPPGGESEQATVGGVVATGDSGPLRHMYGGVRDQVIGIRVALGDGSVAHSGGKVIKNVAGYDLAKLFAGSFGTLGVILEVSLRLHPLATRAVTTVGTSEDSDALHRGALVLSNSPLRASSLDFAWEAGRGTLLARYIGGSARDQAQAAAQMLGEAGLETALDEDDEGMWSAQRAAQRSAGRVVLKISALPTDLPRIIGVAGALGASAVGRAGLGIAWLTLPPERTPAGLVARVDEIRESMGTRPAVLQDAPVEVREAADVWGAQPAGTLALMRRVKDRFDPHCVCNRGIFIGDI